MIRFPDLRIIVGQRHLPMLVLEHSGDPVTRRGEPELAVGVSQGPSFFCLTLRLQWRDRVGLSPTSHDHREASNCDVSIADERYQLIGSDPKGCCLD